ncbi:unnamed protein product [Lampetra fluviatilis]
MGCNLCGSQKQDENYNLLYEVCKVNGKDLSRISHEEAVEALRSAREPITMQVRRKAPLRPRAHGGSQVTVGGTPTATTAAAVGTSAPSPRADAATQTECPPVPEGGKPREQATVAVATETAPTVPAVTPGPRAVQPPDSQILVEECNDGQEYLTSLQQEAERAAEVEFEEVALYRIFRQEKLGLTVCYRTDEEEDLGIYVSEIDPNSIAAKDGRIREGDRILQINGVDIQGREEAVALLTNEKNRRVSLLLARPEIQLDEGWMEDERSEYLEDISMDVLEEQDNQDFEVNASVPQQQMRTPEDDGTTDSAHNGQEKDSGVGRTDESTRNDNDENESSEPEQEIPADDDNQNFAVLTDSSKVTSQVGDKKGTGDALCGNRTGDSTARSDLNIPEMPELLDFKCQMTSAKRLSLYYSATSTLGVGKVDAKIPGDTEIELLNEELRNIEIECRNIMQAHGNSASTHPRNYGDLWRLQDGGNFRTYGRKRSRCLDVTDAPEKSDKDTSSAYNTAESCRSSPQSLKLTAIRSLNRSIESTDSQRSDSGASRASTSVCSSQPGSREASPAKGKVLTLSRKLPESGDVAPAQAAASAGASGSCGGSSAKQLYQKLGRQQAQLQLSPYRRANAPSQSQHYQSYVHLVQQGSSDYGHSQMSLLSVCNEASFSSQQDFSQAEPRGEWKVKVRSDGSRYITKRPVRDRLLKERAMKIKEERSGMTTDDDALSEMKMGRYWSKEQRKQHLNRAREQRRRREFMMRCRLECLNENPHEGGSTAGSGGSAAGSASASASGAESRKEVSILELSHRKMMKKRGKKIFDNWMTIQELLAHGSRSPDGTRIYNHLLSVTTV